jgi:hypothetical protein
MPSAASAANLVDNEELTLDLTGIANGAYAAEIVEEESESRDETDRYGPVLSLARLKLGGRYKDVGDIKIQIGASNGTMQLLDAVAALDLGSPVYVRAGRFKPTISPQFLIGAPNVYTSNRALLNALVPGRLTGFAAGADTNLSGTNVEGEVALFQPDATSFQAPQGQLLTARALVGLSLGLKFHLGYAKRIFGSDTISETVQGENGNTLTRTTPVVPNDSPLDAAIIFDKDDIYAHLEGVAVLEPAPTQSGNDRDTAYGLHVLGAYVIGPDGGLNFEPTVAYDLVDDVNNTHRVTVGGNTYFFDSGIELETHYEFTIMDRPGAGDQQTKHGIFVALQTVL